MGLLDPTASADETERKPLIPRVSEIEGKRVGLLGNGKLAARPVLVTIEERLDERYDDVSVEYYLVDELNQLKDDDELERIEEWATDCDVVITAMGDCGSCTKFLAWATNAVENGGVPAVGLLDEGFVLDWQSNAIEKGRPLRYTVIPVRCEIADIDRIRENITQDVVDDVEEELVRALDENEQNVAVSNS